MSNGNQLSTQQTHALFHYLCHVEAFIEFTSLKVPGRIAAFGPPFVVNTAHPKEDPSPILEKCTREFVLTDSLPAFSKVKDDSTFWGDKVQRILENMAESTLSDSYDKGKVSKRKVLGMSVSVFLANIARGLFGKVAQNQTHDEAKRNPELSKENMNAADLMEAWRTWKIGMIYDSNLTDALALLESAKPTDSWPAHQYAAALYIKLTLASLLHYIFVSSPDGADTLNILKRLHEKLPYWTIRQTLKIPYATQMVQGLIKVFLAKSMFGGKALLQTLISTILGQDQTRCEKGIATIERDGFPKAQADGLKKYVYDTSRAEQVALRERSQAEGISIVAAILGTTKFSQQGHTDCLKYLELQLSRRDRIELIRILTGDEVLTSTIRAGLDIFFPIIAELHKAANLPEGLADAQNFLTELISVSEANGNINKFVSLVDKHESSFIKFASQIIRNSPSMREGYVGWYHHCLKAYTGTPAMELKNSVADMDEQQRTSIMREIDTYSAYLEQKREVSHSRLEAILRKTGDDGFGEWLGILSDVQVDARTTPKTPTAKMPAPVRPDMSVTTGAMLNIFRDGLMARTPEHVPQKEV
ncbi:Putative uncharacterized protein [Taphrina deformans PYCC 5710]|uniref:Uncharacterized protein n=1 Tax=Taphrina deformans (strain PYCC 5710 / ATCC 11124 / CBS 356.35 / IMI 108563 / JCM 9778 / NBRC 8474) TaxID=1097556 RepID=R4X9J5_TAPDE|nr:Putative uncharacterized protein [Taphrina deformans PYCC 5710]|eukprot:CCG82431.1 Putative uncharacterized protein [Taphrina deformans PYCC 5710]